MMLGVLSCAKMLYYFVVSMEEVWIVSDAFFGKVRFQ
jgi:hypothetical protein